MFNAHPTGTVISKRLLGAEQPSDVVVYHKDRSAQIILYSEIEVADQTFHVIQSQYTDSGPTSPSADTMMPGAWQGSH